MLLWNCHHDFRKFLPYQIFTMKCKRINPEYFIEVTKSISTYLSRLSMYFAINFIKSWLMTYFHFKRFFWYFVSINWSIISARIRLESSLEIRISSHFVRNWLREGFSRNFKDWLCFEPFTNFGSKDVKRSLLDEIATCIREYLEHNVSQIANWFWSNTFPRKYFFLTWLKYFCHLKVKSISNQRASCWFNLESLFVR